MSSTSSPPLAAPCTEGHLKATGLDLASHSKYAKYRVASSGEIVYFQDDNDKQADSHFQSLQELKIQNIAKMDDMDFDDVAKVEQEMRSHMNRLHEYNELKDVGQALLGRLAILRGLTTKALYPEFGIELED